MGRQISDGLMLLIAIYIAAMVVANLLVWWLGPWFSPINSFLLIGLDLTLRDVMQERLARFQLAGVICAGGIITWLVNPAAKQIAIASAAAAIMRRGNKMSWRFDIPLNPFAFWLVMAERAFGFGPHAELMRAIREDTQDLKEKWKREHPDEKPSRAE